MIISLDKRIRELRREKGLSIEDLANLINQNKKYVYDLENGIIEPTLSEILALSDALDRSIDYLIRGKEYIDYTPDSILYTISKDNDINLLHSTNILEYIDSDSLNIMSYLLKYDSPLVLDNILKSYKINEILNKLPKEDFYSALIKYNKLDILTTLGFFKSSKDDPLQIFNKNTNINIYSDGYLALFIKYVKYPSSTLDALFTIHKDDFINPINDWQSLYSKAIYYSAYYNRLELLEFITNLVITINNKARELYHRDTMKLTSFTYNLITKPEPRYKRDNISYALVIPHREGIIALLDLGYYQKAVELYQINKHMGLERVHDGAFLKGKLIASGERDINKLILSDSMDQGLLVIDKILKSNNYYLIKNALYNNKLFLSELDNHDGIEEVNKAYLKPNMSPNMIRKDILNLLYPKLINNKKEDISLEYLKSLLYDNEYDTLIIKLAIRLEDLLKHKYNYEGTLDEMLNLYKEEYKPADALYSLLIKLRKCRNSEVHSDKTSMKLTNEELSSLIAIIGDME